MPAGRPTAYSEEILEKTREYVLQFTDPETFPEDEVIPSIEGLSVYLGLSRPTIYDWASQEKKQEFSYIVEQLMSNQGKILVNGTLSNKLNSNIGKAMLSKHGYVEKKETDMTTKGESLNEGIMKALDKTYGSDSD